MKFILTLLLFLPMSASSQNLLGSGLNVPYGTGEGVGSPTTPLGAPIGTAPATPSPQVLNDEATDDSGIQRMEEAADPNRDFDSPTGVQDASGLPSTGVGSGFGTGTGLGDGVGTGMGNETGPGVGQPEPLFP